MNMDNKKFKEGLTNILNEFKTDILNEVDFKKRGRIKHNPPIEYRIGQIEDLIKEHISLCDLLDNVESKK